MACPPTHSPSSRGITTSARAAAPASCGAGGGGRTIPQCLKRCEGAPKSGWWVLWGGVHMYAAGGCGHLKRQGQGTWRGGRSLGRQRSQDTHPGRDGDPVVAPGREGVTVTLSEAEVGVCRCVLVCGTPGCGGSGRRRGTRGEDVAFVDCTHPPPTASPPTGLSRFPAAGGPI